MCDAKEGRLARVAKALRQREEVVAQQGMVELEFSFSDGDFSQQMTSVEHWIHELCEELNERLHSDLEQNKRVAHTLTLHARAYKFNGSNPHKKFPSKSCPLIYGTSKIQEDALNLFRAGLREYLGSYGVKSRGNQYNGWAITALSVSASNIVSKPAGTCSILKYFHNRNQSNDNFIEDDAALSLSGTECYPGLHPTAAQAEFGEEESKITHALPRWDEQDDEKKFLSISELGESFSVETSLSSAAECCSEQNQFQPNQQFPREITNVGFASHGVKPHGQKRHTSKEKGTSILRFFQNCTTSSLHQSDVKTVGESKAFSASGSTCDEQKNGELAQESKVAETESEIGRCSSGQRELGINAWGYKIDEINPSVLNELPQEIREEVWGWLRPQKRANTLKQGSRISHYFLPTKKS